MRDPQVTMGVNTKSWSFHDNWMMQWGYPHDLWTLHMSCVQRHGVEPPRQQAAGCARKQWTAGSVVPRFINVSSLKNRSCFKSTHIYYNWSENFHCFCPSKAVIDAFHGNSMEHSCSSQIWQRNISHGSKIFPAINIHWSIEMMWVKQCHTPSPSHHHFYRWYNGNIYIHIHIVIYLFTHKNHSQVVYGIVLPTLHRIFHGIFRSFSIRTCSATEQPNPKDQEQGHERSSCEWNPTMDETYIGCWNIC